MPGNGTAAAGTYVLTGFSVYESYTTDVPAGSIADGTYAFGSQPDYRFVWDGFAVTGFFRQSGMLTNGLGIFNGPGGAGAYLVFEILYQAAFTDGTTRVGIFESRGVTPDLTPVPSSGLCIGESSPGGESSGEAPPDILEQYGRTFEQTCAATWGPSWAQWMNNSSGGWVCTRTVFWDVSARSWAIRSP